MAHNQVLIDQLPGQLSNREKAILRCPKHGNGFQINGGLCVDRPREGKSLQQLNCIVDNGVNYLEDSG